MPKTPEFSEVVAGTPQQLIGAMKDHHEWLPVLLPEWFSAADRHEGEGHTGSVYHYDIHEDNHDIYGGSSYIKVVMEDYNVKTMSYVANIQGDERFNYLKVRVRFLPGPSPRTSYVKWIVDYSPVSPGTTPEDKHLNLPRAIFKDLAAYLENQ